MPARIKVMIVKHKKIIRKNRDWSISTSKNSKNLKKKY